MKAKILINLFFFTSFLYHGQAITSPDSLSLNLFRNKKVLYVDLGVDNAPFTLSYKDSTGHKEKLLYKNNLRTIFGLGFSYKWFSLRAATNLPLHFKSVTENGETHYRDLVLEFKIKRHFFDVSLHSYLGYAIQDAYKWDETLNEESSPNYIQKKMRSLNLSLSNWLFLNKNIDMSALKGKKGMYLKKQKSFYIKSSINFHGISNSELLIPLIKQNLEIPKTASTTFSSIDIGLVPGYLFVNRYKNWQYSAMFGLGGVFQSKFYIADQIIKNSPGLAPRFDLRLYLAYNVPKCFVIFGSELENKSINFTDMKYKQIYHMMKIVVGIRF